MKDKKRKYILMIILLGVLMLLSGCVRKECEEKVKDLEFTVTKGGRTSGSLKTTD